VHTHYPVPIPTRRSSSRTGTSDAPAVTRFATDRTEGSLYISIYEWINLNVPGQDTSVRVFGGDFITALAGALIRPADVLSSHATPRKRQAQPSTTREIAEAGCSGVRHDPDFDRHHPLPPFSLLPPSSFSSVHMYDPFSDRCFPSIAVGCVYIITLFLFFFVFALVGSGSEQMKVRLECMMTFFFFFFFFFLRFPDRRAELT